MTQIDTFNKLPGVLAFKRGHIISDGLMFNQMPDGNQIPLMVVRHGILGTQNDSKADKQREVANPQITESAKLDNIATAMIVRFNLAFIDIKDTFHSCSGKNKIEKQALRASIDNFFERAKRSEGLKEVARRYARNIANGRWLWRNRIEASSILITAIKSNVDKKETVLANFDALKIPFNHFDNYNADEIKLGEEIANQMLGNSFQTLVIEAIVKPRVPGAEVFPSQNYIENKPKGFARPLYKIGHPESIDNTNIRIMGQAAIRDQKIFNAIRTIDTWYPAYNDEDFPISIEPLGANLGRQEFYRNNKEASLFAMLKRLNHIDPNSPEGMFCIAGFDRGGVLGEKEEDKKNKKNRLIMDSRVLPESINSLRMYTL